MSKRHKIAKINYRKIYENHYGKIPDGYHIHHIDGNPFNNDISNLQCVSAEEHSKIHDNDFVKWASLGGTLGGNISKKMKLGFHSASAEQRYEWSKYANECIDRKKQSISLKNAYSSGKIVHWTKLYDDAEVSRRISSGDPGKSRRGKTAWNKGKKMVLKDRELTNKKKSEAAKNKKKVKCEYCDRFIDISNIKKHVSIKHKT